MPTISQHEMKGSKVLATLTISQPYASLIASGEKWVENRTWFCHHKGPLAIHAGSGTQYLTRRQLRRYPTGQVIAVCEMVACIALEAVRAHGREIQPTEIETMEAAGITLEQLMEHPHAEGPYCFVLQNIRRVAPVACRGRQGLWYFDITGLRALDFPASEGSHCRRAMKLLLSSEVGEVSQELVCAGQEVARILNEAADALEFCEGALVDHFAGEDGLDPEDARRVAWMASDVIRKVGRTSNLHSASQKPCS